MNFIFKMDSNLWKRLSYADTSKIFQLNPVNNTFFSLIFYLDKNDQFKNTSNNSNGNNQLAKNPNDCDPLYQAPINSGLLCQTQNGSGQSKNPTLGFRYVPKRPSNLLKEIHPNIASLPNSKNTSTLQINVEGSFGKSKK